MKVLVIFTMVLTHFFVPAYAAPSSDNEILFDVSMMGDIAVYVDDVRAYFWLYKEGNLIKKIEPVGVSSIKDVPLQASGDLSYDGNYLLISFNTGESSRVTQIYSVLSGELLFEHSAVNAIWEKGRNVALFVPDYGIAEEQNISGLLSYDASSGKSKRLFISYYFTGQIVAGEKYFVANIVIKNNETSEFKTIIGKLSNGSAIVIAGE